MRPWIRMLAFSRTATTNLLAGTLLAHATIWGWALGFGGFRLTPGSWAVVGGLLGALWAAHAFYASRGSERLSRVCLTTFWGFLLANLYIVPMYVIVREAPALRDDWLLEADSWLSFSSAAVVSWSHAHPGMGAGLDVIYSSLPFVCLLSLFVPSFLGKDAVATEYLVATAISLNVSTALFAIVPAVGPFCFHSAMSASDAQSSCETAFRAVRAKTPFVIDLLAPDALVSFPSGHVVLALLAARALGGVRWLGLPAALWACALVLSTLSTGWHYLVDVAAGVAVAVGASLFARRFVSWSRIREAQSAEAALLDA